MVIHVLNGKEVMKHIARHDKILSVIKNAIL